MFAKWRRAAPRSLAWSMTTVAVAVVAVVLGTSGVLSPARAGGKNIEGMVNLNTAPPELLSLLPGVGPSKARGIVAYRSRRPFRTVDELVRIKGIGRRMVREMRVHLAIAGPSTVRVIAGARIASAPPARPPPVVPAPRLSCRPGAPLPNRAIVRSPRAPPVRTRRSAVNHCLPPA
ncbi:MAG: helix-hairpin-helix domain-containing protein [Pseudomonadota bacterium]